MVSRYSWSIINTTVSIFSAVMIFNGVDEVGLFLFVNPLLGEFPQGWRQVARVIVGYLVFLAWFTVAHIMIAYVSNALKRQGFEGELEEGETQGRSWVVNDTVRGDNGQPVEPTLVRPGGREKSVAIVGNVEVFVMTKDLAKQGFEQRTKCWSMLYAHMAGFAMISAGGDLQHAEPFRGSSVMSFVSVAVNVLFLLSLFRLSRAMRPTVEDSDDEEEAEAVRLCEEHAIEAEDELFCLSISFLFVQAVRYSVTGVLSTKNGSEPGEEFGLREIATVYGVGVLAVAGAFLMALSGYSRRLADLARGTFCMAFAWCLLFASRWMFESWRLLVTLDVSPRTIEGRVVLALFLSTFTAFAIIVLDKFEDTSRNPRLAHNVVKNLVTGLSILVGFTWEHVVDGCTEAIASIYHGHELKKLVSKVVGATIIPLVVLPAWRRHVLQKVLMLMKHKKDKRVAERLAQMVSGGKIELSSSEDEPDADLAW
ncbi:ANKRD17 [Symbiodinium natans]|uniref:ANKRD17 protein n=1 Tax=Symbiodinium natans TaxID=878477 RepID=A0A812R514_9DINO|nr:ANKRD17 [Symbiodinium natans]